ncbi:MAG: hypothetical protein E6Q67_15505 [Roseateles sp.]|nr:MAG: hypothetical protein E6Q67_15505 [Roseateles sp.]
MMVTQTLPADASRMMDMHTADTRHAPPLTAPILTTEELLRAQRELAAAVAPVGPPQQLPLTAAAGRVLAQDLALNPVAHAAAAPERLPSGTRLDWLMLPQLAAAEHHTVSVQPLLRCAITTLQAGATVDAQEKVCAVLLQSALERLGVKALCTGAVPRTKRSTLQGLARHCDLLLVIASPAGEPPRGPGLQAPTRFEMAGCVCVVLPADAEAALASFVAFVVPLIHGLQGRRPFAKPLQYALDDGASVQHSLTWVKATYAGPGQAGLRVRAGPAMARPGRLSRPCGLAWRASDLQRADRRTVAFLPLRDWLD